MLMGDSLKGKTALVTGASCISESEHGLGYAIAMQLALEGANVAIVSSDQANIDRAAGLIRSKTDVKVTSLKADLTDKKERASIKGRLTGDFDHIDILAISTGHPPTVSADEVTADHWQRGYKLCVEPAFFLPHYFLDGMQAEGYGRVLFVGSPYGIWFNNDSVVQSGVRGMVNVNAGALAGSRGGDGVTLNVFCPGYYQTGLISRLAQQKAMRVGGSAAAVIDSWKETSPTNEIGDPMDIGRMAATLARPDNTINGKAIVPNWKVADPSMFHYDNSLPNVPLVNLINRGV